MAQLCLEVVQRSKVKIWTCLDDLVSWWLIAISAFFEKKNRVMLGLSSGSSTADWPTLISYYQILNNHPFHLHLEYPSEPCRGKRGNTLLWICDCTEESHLTQKAKHRQSLLTEKNENAPRYHGPHTSMQKHIHKSSKVIGLSHLAHFTLWIKNHPFASQKHNHPPALCFSLNSCNVFSVSPSSLEWFSELRAHLDHCGRFASDPVAETLFTFPAKGAADASNFKQSPKQRKISGLSFLHPLMLPKFHWVSRPFFTHMAACTHTCIFHSHTPLNTCTCVPGTFKCMLWTCVHTFDKYTRT